MFLRVLVIGVNDLPISINVLLPVGIFHNSHIWIADWFVEGF